MKARVELRQAGDVVSTNIPLFIIFLTVSFDLWDNFTIGWPFSRRSAIHDKEEFSLAVVVAAFALIVDKLGHVSWLPCHIRPPFRLPSDLTPGATDFVNP